MIVSEKGLWKKVLPVYGKSAALSFAISGAASYAYLNLHWKWIALPMMPFTLVGTGIALMLSFRNNEAYNRYWEARTLWGQVLANSRSFARAVLTLTRPGASGRGRADETIPPELEATRRDLVERTIAFLHSLPPALRGKSSADCDFEELGRFLSPDEVDALREQKNVPAAILQTQAERVVEAWRNDFLHPQHVTILEEDLSALTLAFGGCEKIARTPIPPAYGFLARRIVWVFVSLIPFGFVETLGWKTLLLAPLVGFLFGALQRFGEEIQHPFEMRDDGLPLNALTLSLEAELRQRLGDAPRELPEPARDRDGVLL